ncbi:MULTISPECIES: OmpA family protein [unclassified Vibrio]|uniref:OmpA family protein n=1 Tax=unclassified Vibrio TaxID=2614977 RepID=UPI0013612BF0|nr:MULTISPECIES: OmpA family protein [unclassified Vibrio]NAW56484.1 OmpA family protein [Vibrio sp. V36_P2S2PM302]NAX25791.1 OmpA family protein [Vibrio sp. V38_P2S17PM301]NAX29154.1 OmpA family protein [Vibrio sp. V37_P2S8PM304]
MKYYVYPLILLLAGCGTLPAEVKKWGSMLETAPQNDSELMHPEWRKPALTSGTGSYSAYNTQPSQPQPRNYGSNSYHELQNFLASNGVDYEVLPGEYIMVKLNNTVKFNTGSARVLQESGSWLDLVGRYLATQPDIDVVIDGHADSTGTANFNDGLSKRRAAAVKDRLVRNQVSQTSIFTRGYGEYVPACTNKTSAGRSCNRRVEVRFIVSNN